VEPLLAHTPRAGLHDALRDQLLELAGQVSGTIGVICPPSLIRDVQLFVMQDVRLREFENRLIVVTALQAKGLEYDGVVVVSPDGIVAEAPGAERVLYVALTRATQRMVTLDVDTSRWRSLLA
jgi:DNA helicase IV